MFAVSYVEPFICFFESKYNNLHLALLHFNFGYIDSAKILLNHDSDIQHVTVSF